jgi:serine protease AprX
MVMPQHPPHHAEEREEHVVEARAMKWRILIPALVLLCLLAGPLPAQAAGDLAVVDPSVVTVIEATGGEVPVPVIVYTSDPSCTDGLVPLGVDTVRLPVIDALAAYLTPAEIGELAGDAAVQAIVADNPVFGFGGPASMDVTNLTIGLGAVPAPEDGGPAGRGVGVAVLDSGVSVNPDLPAGRLAGWKDFVNGRTAPYDDAGHGTFVAGLVGGDGSASLPLEDGGYAQVQFRGVAPQADIVAVKILDETGQGRASTLIAGIAWTIAHRQEYGIRVMNLSIGANPVGPIAVDPIARAVEAAWRQGIVVVAAAGNEGAQGMGSILSPGNDPFIITVGATDTRQTADVTDDVVADYSSWGPTLFDEFAKPDLVAPGNRLVSLRVKGSYIDRAFPENVIPLADFAPAAPAGTESNYLKLSGTSTSTPVVAGAAALLLEDEPGLTPDDVKVRLMGTADRVAGASVHQQGAGTVDVDEALGSELHAGGPALSADLGDGLTILTEDTYKAWETTVWKKYGWTKFKWTKFKWTKFKWTKFKWTKFKWTELAWTKFKWTKFKWTDYEAEKFKWTKFKWTVLTEGQ